MGLVSHRQSLRADRCGEIPRGSVAVGQRVEVAGVVEGITQRPFRVAQCLGEIAIGVRDKPSILIVGVGIVWYLLDLLLHAGQRCLNAVERGLPLLGRVVGHVVERDQGIDIAE